MIQYFISLLIQLGIYTILALSFNLALGFTGIINLGHIAFFALGAYGSTLLYMKLGLPYLLAILSGGFISCLAALFLMAACRKLKGDYLALGTLSFHFVIYSLLLNLDGLTGGTRGLTFKRPAFIETNMSFMLFVGLLVIIAILTFRRLVRSPFGTLLGAVRDDEELARSLGKNSQLVKLKALTLSAFVAGVSGGLIATFLRYVHPDFFFLYELVTVLTIVIMGGLASLRGTVVATFIVLLLPELLRFVALPSVVVGPARQLLYSVILLAILLINARGLFGKVDLQ